MTQFGIRILGIPKGTTERQLKVHFRNPRHGGGKISKLLYPLLNNDAVIYFEDMTGDSELLAKEQIFQGQELEIQILPRTVFTEVTVHLDSEVTNFLDENSEYLDNLQFDGDLIVTFDSETMSYHMSGTWYQVEWAWAYLEGIHSGRDTDMHGKTPLDADDHKTVESWTLSKQSETLDKKTVASRQSEAHDKKSVLFEKDSRVSLKDKQSRNNMTWDFNKHKSYTAYRGSQGTLENKESLVEPSRTYCAFDMSRMTSEPIVQNNRRGHTNDDKVNVKSNTGARGLDFISSNPTSDLYRSIESSQDRRNLHLNVESNTASSDSSEEENGDSYSVNLGCSDEDIPVIQRFVDRPPETCLSITRSDFQDVPLTYEIEIGAVTITVSLGDLIQQKTDAIVSPASSDLSNRFGIAAALARAAGKKLQKECKSFVEKNGTLFIGDVVHTCAGGMLDEHVGFVLHAVGPTWREKFADQTAHLLTCTYLNCFQYANKQLWLKSLSLPLISTGVFGVPLDVCVQSFYDALHLHVSEDPDSRHLVHVKLLSNDQDSACAMIVVLRSLLDTKEEEARQSSIERYKNRSIKYEFTARDFYLDSDIEKQQFKNRKENTKRASSNSNTNGEEEAQQGSTNEEYESQKEVHALERDTLEPMDRSTDSRGTISTGITHVDFRDDSKDENRNSDEEYSSMMTKDKSVMTTRESFAIDKNTEDDDDNDHVQNNNDDDVSSNISATLANDNADVSSNITDVATAADAAADDDVNNDDDDDDDDDDGSKYKKSSTNLSTKESLNEYLSEKEEIEDEEI